MIHMLRARMAIADNTLEQMGNVSGEIEIIRKTQKEILKIKTKQNKTL